MIKYVLIFLAIIIVLSIVFILIANALTEKSFKREDNPNKDANGEWLKVIDFISNRSNEMMKKNPETWEYKDKLGIKRKAYFFRNIQSNIYIIFSHGWHGNGLRDFNLCCPFYFEQGYNLLIPDHLGHGRSDGDYIGFGITDFEPIIEWTKMVDKKFKGNKSIFIHGISMGANISLLTANKVPPSVKGIIADSGFISAKEEFKYLLKRQMWMFYLPLLWAVTLVCKKKYGIDINKFSTLDTLKNTKTPILFIHGDQDKFVPLFMTKRNFNACVSLKELYITSNKGHALSFHYNQIEYKNKTIEFINKYKGEN